MTTKEYNSVIFIAENLSPIDFLNLEIDLNDSRFVRSSRHSLSTYDCIPPRHRQIIFLTEWTNEQGQYAKMEYMYKFQHVKKPNPSIPEIYDTQNNFHSFRPF